MKSEVSGDIIYMRPTVILLITCIYFVIAHFLSILTMACNCGTTCHLE